MQVDVGRRIVPVYDLSCVVLNATEPLTPFSRRFLSVMRMMPPAESAS